MTDKEHPEVARYMEQVKPFIEEIERQKQALKNPLKQQVGGSHYKDMEIQPVEFIHRNGIGFIAGNAIKYLCRYKAKNGVEDLQKAKHYIEMLIEQETKETT